MSIPVFCPYIRRKDMDSVLNCLVTDSIGPGEYADRFIKSLKESLNFDFGFALRSPFTALCYAFEALGLKEGDTILVSALAPAYYARAAAEKGIGLAIADCAENSLQPDLECIKQAIAASAVKPSAYILFEPLGIIPDLSGFEETGLRIVEDITQGIKAYRGELKAGSIGGLAMLGLENRGIVTTGGGAVLFAKARREGMVLRNIAEEVPAELRMTDYNAALGWAQLRGLEMNLETRRTIYQAFGASIARTKHHLLAVEGEGEAGFWAFPVALESGVKDVCAYAKKKEIDTELAFEDSLAGKGLVPEGQCPRARSLALRSILFPLHERIGKAGVQKIERLLGTLP